MSHLLKLLSAKVSELFLIAVGSLICGTMTDLSASEDITITSTGQQPRVAVVGDRVAITYAVGETVMIALSTDGGKTFGAPTKVGVIPKLAAGMRRGPQVAMTEKALVVAGISSGDGNMISWRSLDSGSTWGSPIIINDKPSAAREGLFSITAGKGESIWSVWLDLRSGPTKIAMSTSSDGGATWSPNAILYQAPAGAVCECCQPTIAADGTGGIAVMWRNQVAGARDMWMCSSKNGGKNFSKPEKLGNGTWKLDACPMDGGGVAISGASIQTIWRRATTIFTCQPMQKKETDLGPGKNSTIAFSGKKVYRSWQNGESIQVMIDDEKAQTIGSGSYPHLAAAMDSTGPVVLVWQNGSEIKVRRLDL